MRKRVSHIKGGRRGSKSNDFISQMSDDILVIILSLLPIKDAVVTSILSTRWRFLWCNLLQLNFDGSEASDKIAENQGNQKLRRLERSEFVDQVNGVFKSYNHPMIQYLRIRFDFNYRHAEDINEWLQFAADKKVEMLELDLMKGGIKIRDPFLSYDFPFQLSDRYIKHLFELPSTSSVTVVELIYLKKLVLKGVNLSEATLEEILINSSQLETLCIHRSAYLTHIEVGGQALNLKHFEVTNCCEVESIYLYEFNIVSFTYKGHAIDLRITDLPKLKELDIGKGLSRLKYDVFGQISSCFSYLQVLSFKILNPKKSKILKSFPELPNVKKLVLTIGAHEDDCLLEVASVANLCPSLETFMIKLLWYSPIKTRTNVRHDATHPHQHLKLLDIQGYYGRVSDLELVAFFIDNVVALKKILIDPRCQNAADKKFPLTMEETARSSAKQQLQSLTPRGVKLVIF